MTPLGYSIQELDNSVGKSDTFPELRGPDYSNKDWDDLLALISESQLLPEPTLSQALNRCSLNFLDRITRETGLVHSFDCGTQEQREQVLMKLELQLSCGLRQASVSTLSSQPITEDEYMDLPGQESLGLLNTLNSFSQVWLDNPLSLKTHEILLLVKAVVEVKPRNSSVHLNWSPALEKECLQFFSPPKLCKFLGLYWAIWHPNVNFVHRPTFDPMSAKPTLLAAMALIGASVSPSQTDNENARVWFDCVEEIVFTDEDFNSDLMYSTVDRISVHRRNIQSLQAAYMVCLYQNWEGTDCSKSRIRRYRFATLVSTARDINIATATHVNYCKTQRYDFRWSDFAAREELIRVFIWIFLLDTAFVIFNNAPPRMTIKEMKMHMAVPEACFQATSPNDCFETIQLILPEDNQYWDISFRSAFESLCKSHVPPRSLHNLGSLGPLNLFALASAIHCLVFQHRNSFDGCQLPSAIHNSLRNWKDAWDVFSSAYSSSPSAHVTVDSTDLRPDIMWKRLGFSRFCPEYWSLASLIVDQLILRDTSEERSDQYAQGQGSNPLDNLVSEKILDKYDQTSMRQVNDLIGEFQKFQIV
ncbi:hypothetical protein PVAR5_4643 [Paecilomyces variotii No. 5]|uniref:Xylanolytic transcriptional activator regulatory domain-containing protein n=1 Tax=Byssochlamys spectabilis (strain No. 5 / NBRC 109023) TaxID=1356009 RepID=V5FEV1_BYSSN|nr:hypothetical protein PVAR5_4643 [Paecilomyces variotii No. 5]